MHTDARARIYIGICTFGVPTKRLWGIKIGNEIKGESHVRTWQPCPWHHVVV